MSHVIGDTQAPDSQGGTGSLLAIWTDDTARAYNERLEKAQRDRVSQFAEVKRKVEQKWQAVIADRDAEIADRDATIAARAAEIANRAAKIADRESP